MLSTGYCAGRNVTFLFYFSCQFISSWVNAGKQMRWIFVRNAVNFAVNCVEKRPIIFFHRIHCFHRISYNNLPQNSMPWIFIRNAVNFCKKCGEMHWNNYFHRIHRNLRISYKNLPKNLDPCLRSFLNLQDWRKNILNVYIDISLFNWCQF